MLVAALAFGGQSFVAQTHVHIAEATCLAAGTTIGCDQDARSGSHPKSPLQQRSECPLCQAHTLTGHALAPPSFTLAPLPATAAWWVTATLVAVAALARSHAWRSRAPPRPLSA